MPRCALHEICAGMIGFYCDWRSQEVAIAAAHFDDPVLREEYESATSITLSRACAASPRIRIRPGGRRPIHRSATG